jgi:hypothetical protein
LLIPQATMILNGNISQFIYQQDEFDAGWFIKQQNVTNAFWFVLQQS